MNKIKALRKSAGLTQKAFGELLNIPKRTIENWEAGTNKPAAGLVELIEYYLKNENYIKMEDVENADIGRHKKTNYHDGVERTTCES